MHLSSPGADIVTYESRDRGISRKLTVAGTNRGAARRNARICRSGKWDVRHPWCGNGPATMRLTVVRQEVVVQEGNNAEPTHRGSGRFGQGSTDLHQRKPNDEP